MTPLETTSITVIVGLLVGVAVRQLTQSKVVTRKECEANHQHETGRHEQVIAEIQSIRRHQQAQSRMIRALVVHSGIERHQQQKILNERETDG